MSAFSQSWVGEHNWVHPPISDLDQVALKLRLEPCRATVVAPYWPQKSWFRELLELSSSMDVIPSAVAVSTETDRTEQQDESTEQHDEDLINLIRAGTRTEDDHGLSSEKEIYTWLTANSMKNILSLAQYVKTTPRCHTRLLQ